MNADDDLEVIFSDLCADVEIDGHFLTVGIYKTDIDPSWILEVVNEFGTSTVFDDPFIADGLAWQQFEKTVKEKPRCLPHKERKTTAFQLTPARLFSPSIYGVFGLLSLAHVAPSMTLSLCKTSDIPEWRLHTRGHVG